MVESRCGAVTVGSACLFPSLSSDGAQVAWPYPRFHIPLIEPDVQFSCIRLSDKTSRFRPRKVMGPRRQMDQPQRVVEIPIGVARPPIAANLVFLAQPLAEPLCGMGIDRPIGRTDWTEAKVIRPADQFTVQPSHDKLGIQ